MEHLNNNNNNNIKINYLCGVDDDDRDKSIQPMQTLMYDLMEEGFLEPMDAIRSCPYCQAYVNQPPAIIDGGDKATTDETNNQGDILENEESADLVELDDLEPYLELPLEYQNFSSIIVDSSSCSTPKEVFDEVEAMLQKFSSFGFDVADFLDARNAPRVVQSTWL